MENWAKMSFEKLLKEIETYGDGIDLSMKRPTLGTRTVKDKTRQATLLKCSPVQLVASNQRLNLRLESQASVWSTLKAQGCCSMCRTEKQFHNRDGKVHLHGPPPYHIQSLINFHLMQYASHLQTRKTTKPQGLGSQLTRLPSAAD